MLVLFRALVRMAKEAAETKKWVEGEEVARKALRREHLQRVRQTREEETKKKEVSLAEQKTR